MDSELADIAVTLYTGSPTEFITARNARAADTDDPALAARIRALKKPSVAAWVVNLRDRRLLQGPDSGLSLIHI